MKNSVNKNTLKMIRENFTTKSEVISVCFILYFKLHLKKGILLLKGISINDMYKHINNDKYLFDFKSVENFQKHIEIELNNISRIYGPQFKERCKSRWNELGLNSINKEIKYNKNGIQKIIEIIDEKFEFFSIDNLMDLYEVLNGSDRVLNEFYTPYDICNLVGEILINIEKKKEIKLCDPTIGMGRLLYYSFIKFKNKYPDIKINLYGMDLNSKSVVFSESIFYLINDNVFIEYGNCFKDMNKFPTMDVIVGNPPFGKIIL